MIFIFILAFVTRFIYLGRIPPGLSEVFLGRVFSALSGFLSIVLIYFLIKKLFNNCDLALFTSSILTLLPISIVENRIVSWVSTAVLLIIVGYFLMIDRLIYKKIIGIVLLIIFLWYIDKEILLLERLLKDIDLILLVNNFFDLASFNKLFFVNDTFWFGGIRRYGMIYSEMIPLFFVGIYELINKKQFQFLIFGLIVLFFSSLSPTYPEAREVSLLMPVLAIILGFGSLKIFNYFKLRKKNIFTSILGLVYILILFYGVMNFFHYYFVHYSFEVEQENVYQINKF